MNKINYTKLQDESEMTCTQKFLLSYNIENKTDYFEIEKNKIQNEIDVFCFDSNRNIIKIQIKKAHPSHAGNVGKSIKKTINEKMVIRRNEVVEDIRQNIILVNKKYKDTGKDLSDIILLLDDLTSIPPFLLKPLMGIHTGFKEVWLIPRKADSIRLT